MIIMVPQCDFFFSSFSFSLSCMFFLIFFPDDFIMLIDDVDDTYFFPDDRLLCRLMM